MSYLQNNVSIIIPAGTVISYPGVIGGTNNTPPPSGWLLCDGASYSISTYSALYNVIGTAYGTTGAGNFNVPNFQAAFLRGAGTQTYPTSGGTTYDGSSINTARGTNVQSHTHNYSANTNTHNHNLSNFHRHDFTYPQSYSAAHYHNGNIGNITVFATTANGANRRSNYTTTDYSNAGNGTINTNTGYSNFTVSRGSTGLTIKNSTPTYNSDANTSNTTPNETIPFNYAINWIIKY